MTYQVEVRARNIADTYERQVFRTCVTLCAVDEDGKKTPLPRK